MRPLAYTFPYWIAFWAVYAWAFFPELKFVAGRQQGEPKSQSRDSGSLNILILVQAAGMLSAMGLSFWKATRFPAPSLPYCLWSGLALLIAGRALRWYCQRLLGKYFTGDVRVAREQRVVTSGPYRWVRHPAYTGGILMFAGIGVALGSWLSTLILFLSALLSYVYRIRIEEAALLEEFGEAYRDFMETRKRIIPFLY